MGEVTSSAEPIPYDSTNDTVNHIARVRSLMAQMQHNLHVRGTVHDDSKLKSPEKEIFDVMTPKLKACTYGSDEYKGFLAEMKVALDHHYAANTHHPEHYKEGIRGMDLLDLIEMFCDWKAATERHADGSLEKSIQINQKRFNYSDDIKAIFENTRVRIGW